MATVASPGPKPTPTARRAPSAHAWYLVHAVVWAVAVVVHSRWGGGGCRERGWKRALGVYTTRKTGCVLVRWDQEYRGAARGVA